MSVAIEPWSVAIIIHHQLLPPHRRRLFCAQAGRIDQIELLQLQVDK